MAAKMKTELYVNKQGGGIHIVPDDAVITGDVFFVDSGGGGADTAGYGRHPESPCLTIDYAVGLCVAARNDIIYVMPGHAETLSAGGECVLDVQGISVIGLGWGADKPAITFDTAIGADVDIDADNVLIENITFIAGFDDITNAIDVNADDFTIRNCEFRVTGTFNFLVCIQDAAAGGSDRITIENCYQLDRDASNTHFVNFAGTGDGHIVRDNILLGDYGTMCIGGAGVVTNATVTGNLISSAANTVDSMVNFDATATGIVAHNIGGGAAAVANGFLATAMINVENYYQLVTADLSGVLDPIAT